MRERGWSLTNLVDGEFSALPALGFGLILGSWKVTHFEEGPFFSAIAASGARAFLIGRRALIALGLPLLTWDYDFWIHGDDVETYVCSKRCARRNPHERTKTHMRPGGSD